MADQDSLSPDQLDKVMEFQETTGCTDVCACVAALAEAQWQVEEAVHAHLTHAADQPTEDSPEVRRRRGVGQQLEEGESGDPQEPPTEETQPPTPPTTSLWSWGGRGGNRSTLQRLVDLVVLVGFSLPGWLLVRGPLRLCCWSLNSALGLLSSLLSSEGARGSRVGRGGADPQADVAEFLRAYDARHPGPRPPFLQCSYSHALSLARQQLQFLLVYLHCSDHLHTDTFCRDVLSHPDVLEFIRAHDILCWGCDVSLAEGYKVSQALRENGYPYVALLVLRNTRVSVVGRLEGPTLLCPQRLVTALAAQYDRATPYVTAARLTRLEREQTVALRQEQDSAYEASLRADREKAKRRQDERQREEADRLRQEEEERLVVRHKTRMREMVPQEPPPGTPASLELVLKLPSGDRIERRFLVTDRLSSLYAVIYTHEGAPERFEVTTNFPRCVLPCLPPPPLRSPPEGEDAEDPSFGDLNVATRSVLFVKDLDA